MKQYWECGGCHAFVLMRLDMCPNCGNMGNPQLAKKLFFREKKAEDLKHPLTVSGISNKILARQVASLRYDSLQEFLSHLAKCLHVDARKDKKRGRKRLASHLANTALAVDNAALICRHTWAICKPYMIKE